MANQGCGGPSCSRPWTRWPGASLVWAKNSRTKCGRCGDGVERGQGQSGDVHGHKDGSERAVNTEGPAYRGDASGEDLERGGSDTGVEGAGTAVFMSENMMPATMMARMPTKDSTIMAP